LDVTCEHPDSIGLSPSVEGLHWVVKNGLMLLQQIMQ